MKTSIGLFNTSKVNRSGLSFPVEGLVASVGQSWKSGLPMFISHDMHRPIGWSTTVGLLISPEFVGVVGATHLADTDEELERAASAAYRYLNEQTLDVAPEDARRLRDAIGFTLKDDTQVVRLDAVSVVEEGIAARVRPELFTTEDDKDGLTALANLKQVGPGVYETKGLLVFAHNYFRRSMSPLNSLNNEFLSLLGECSQRQDLLVKVAIDPDVVALPGTWKSRLELQYWWGPKFNDQLPEIDEGVTHHEGNPELRLYHGIARMEFWWHSANGIKTLEAEEVLCKPSWGLSEKEFASRYVHSMVDSECGKPNHLDGSVRIYDSEKNHLRLKESINNAGRDTRYRKLWRIDGPLDVPTWKSLISHFYRDNRLVGEYFKGVDTVLAGEDDTEKRSRSPLADYLPSCVGADEGALITVSFGPLEQTKTTAAVRIKAQQRFVDGDDATDCIEFSALDYLKLLKKTHLTLCLPDKYMTMAIEDMDINLPLVSHGGVEATRNADSSLTVLGEFVSGLAARSPNRFLTAGLSVTYLDREVTFSFAGFVEPLSRLFSSLDSLPGTLEDLASWCERAHLSSKSIFEGAQYSPEHLQLVSAAGTLIMRRTGAKVEPIPDSGGEFGIEIGAEGPMAEAVKSGRITVVPQFDVRRAVCSACGDSYFDCACTALLDDRCSVKIHDCEFYGYVWTARPAREKELNKRGRP